MFRNFGEIDVEWDGNSAQPRVVVRIYDIYGQVCVSFIGKIKSCEVYLQVQREHTLPVTEMEIHPEYAASTHVMECARSSPHLGLSNGCRLVNID